MFLDTGLSIEDIRLVVPRHWSLHKVYQVCYFCVLLIRSDPYFLWFPTPLRPPPTLVSPSRKCVLFIDVDSVGSIFVLWFHHLASPTLIYFHLLYGGFVSNSFSTPKLGPWYVSFLFILMGNCRKFSKFHSQYRSPPALKLGEEATETGDDVSPAKHKTPPPSFQTPGSGTPALKTYFL